MLMPSTITPTTEMGARGMTDQQNHASRTHQKHSTMKPKLSASIILTKQQAQDQLIVRLQLNTLLYLIPSVLLAGNCLTVARVGIIMISLNHGIISLRPILSLLQMELQQMQPRLSLIHFPTSTLAATTGIQVACTTRVPMATTGPLLYLVVTMLTS